MYEKCIFGCKSCEGRLQKANITTNSSLSIIKSMWISIIECNEVVGPPAAIVSFLNWPSEKMFPNKFCRSFSKAMPGFLPIITLPLVSSKSNIVFKLKFVSETIINVEFGPMANPHDFKKEKEVHEKLLPQLLQDNAKAFDRSSL